MKFVFNIRKSNLMNKPNISQKGSYVIEVQEGKKYFWCAGRREARATNTYQRE